jgi:hypothetical protein
MGISGIQWVKREILSMRICGAVFTPSRPIRGRSRALDWGYDDILHYGTTANFFVDRKG